MEKITQELIDELNKVKLCMTDGRCRGVQVLAYRSDGKYGEYADGTKKQAMKLNNITALDLINKICDKDYYFECRKRALKQYYEDLKKDPNAELKPKNGACAAFPFLDYRYKVEEDGNITNLAYLKFRGTLLFDGDFDVKSGKITLDEAKAMSQEILKRLYVRLKQYEWFIFCCESTSAKGIHIYTHNEVPEFDIEYLEDGTKRWIEGMEKEDYAKYCIKYRNLSYQKKLYYIYKELKPIWEELNLECIQPLNSFFDSAMYTHVGQPFNITPMHKGPILLNPGFKCNIDFDLLKLAKDNFINDIRDIEGLDKEYVGIVSDNIGLLDWHATDSDFEFKTVMDVKSKDYDISKSFSKEGFYFGHDTKHNTTVTTEEGKIEVETPLIKEVMHTLKCFYDDDEIEEIWKSDGFYNQDPGEANVLDWIKRWKEFDKDNNVVPRENYVPSKRIVSFLNKWCGFNIRYEDYTISLKNKDLVEIKLSENEFLGDYWENIIKAIDNKNGIYLVIAPTGSGKTVTHTNNNKKVNDDVFNYYLQKPVIITEPYNSILMSKFNDESICVITGSKRFPKELSSRSMYATNYIHFRQLNEEDIKLFKYIIIDESHLLTHEEFRVKQTSDFIDKVKELSKSSIVILQTATPMDEQIVFNISGTFKLVKEDKRHITYKYAKFDTNDKFSIYWCYDLVKSKLKDGIKTYVYCNNIGLREARVFASLFEDEHKVAVYHKRIIEKKEYEGSPMQYITEHHAMGEYELLVSSVYFGVGNDLNDEIDDACCIIIGNNPWQEDVQVFGRFRNAKMIETIVVLDKDFDDRRYNYTKLLHYAEKNALWNLNDKTKRNNSNVIWSKIESTEEARTYAITKINEQYHSSKVQKDTMLPLYVNEYDEEVQLIKPDESKIEEVKETYKELSALTLDDKARTIKQIQEDKNAKIEYKKEPKYDKWANTVKRLRFLVPDDVFNKAASKLKAFNVIHTIGLYNDILKKLYDGKLDYAEIAAFEHYRNSEKTFEDFIHAFLIWYFYCNYDDPNDYMIESNWWFDFKWKCKNYSKIPDCLIDFLFNDAKVFNKASEINELMTLEEFFGEGSLKDEIDKVKESVIEYNPNGKITGYKKSKMTLDELVAWIKEKDKKFNDENKKEGAKKGGRIAGTNNNHKKSVIITESFKHREKYKLQVGQIYLSCEELAKHTGKSVQSVSQWVKKGWVRKLPV